jgi:multiple antibiotic resistance protein
VFAEAFVSFLAIIDPIGNVIVFHLFTRSYALRQKLTAAVVSIVAAWLMLVSFSLGGQEVLDFLGISSGSFRVAAGLLLLPPAYRLVMEGQPHVGDGPSAADTLDFALVPLATPLIAGPGALAATTSFSQTAGWETTIAAVSLVLLLTLVSFAAADLLFRLAGAVLLRLAARAVGILLFAIAVDFVLDGARDFIETSALAILA